MKNDKDSGKKKAMRINKIKKSLAFWKAKLDTPPTSPTKPTSKEIKTKTEEINTKKYTTMDSLKVNFEILQQINLPDFFKEHSLIVAKYLG